MPDTPNWDTYTAEMLRWDTIPLGQMTGESHTVDTGKTLVDVSASNNGGGSGTYVSNHNGDYLRAEAALGETSTTTFTFRDDPSDTTSQVRTAENLVFGISDIDGRGTEGNGQSDQITISAVDIYGNPMWIDYEVGAANPTYSVVRNGNSITITGARGTNSSTISALRKFITVTINGPISELTISHTNVGNQNISSHVYYSEMEFQPSAAPCFTLGTMIRTEHGEVAVEDLEVGDLVMTRDNGAQPVRWIDSTRRALRAGSRLAPVRISAGALGDNLPESDLLVSPQHRMLVRSAIAQRMFGTDEVLVAAKQLLQINGIDIADDLDEVVYVHFIFDRHEIVYANGAESESLYTGPEALKTLSPQAREEILALFPELAEDALPEPARVLASGRLGRKLAVRHAQNDKPLVG